MNVCNKCDVFKLKGFKFCASCGKILKENDMNIEEMIEQQVEKAIEKLRCTSIITGLDFTQRDETWFRLGISKGISISGSMLSNIPPDVTNKAKLNEPNPNIVICPNCNKIIVKDETCVLTSNPPKIKYDCDSCGHVEYKVVT